MGVPMDVVLDLAARAVKGDAGHPVILVVFQVDGRVALRDFNAFSVRIQVADLGGIFPALVILAFHDGESGRPLADFFFRIHENILDNAPAGVDSHQQIRFAICLFRLSAGNRHPEQENRQGCQ